MAAIFFGVYGGLANVAVTGIGAVNTASSLISLETKINALDKALVIAEEAVG